MHLVLPLRFFDFMCCISSKYVLFCSEGNIDLDLDGYGGRMFLRVLVHLSMHEYAPLVTGALQLLLRHFGQRQEVLQAFKQVHSVVRITRGF